MRRDPPWRWNLWGPWSPGETNPPPDRKEQIRSLAERLSKQRPYLSAEQNWLQAERALRHKPWRPGVIHFSGDKERSGWDWADLLLKLSIPILILGLSMAYSIISSSRQEKIALDQKESDVVTEFIKEMNPLLLEKGLKNASRSSEVIGVARGLTIATLSRLKSEDAPSKRTIIMRYLIDSGVTNSGNLFSLAGSNLSGVNLSRADLRGANLSEADLKGANLSEANLRGAILSGANLMGANLFKADLSGAYFNGANLSKANLLEADLSGADFSEIFLEVSGANLSGANLMGANLRRAKLKGAFFRETICPDGVKSNKRCPVNKTW